MDNETFLIVQRGEDIGRRYDLDTVQLTVGRGSDNDMVLNDPMVSRYHAVVKRQSGRYVLIDLGSANPVVVNDQVLEVGLPHPLSHRDVIFIGKTVFSFQSRSAGSQPAATARDDAAARRSPERPNERQTPQPMTPTMETSLPKAGGAAAGRPLPPPPSYDVQDDESGKTMMGPIQLGDPAPVAQPHHGPPSGNAPAAPPEPPTNPSMRTPPGPLPPLPPLGAAPPGGAPPAPRFPAPPGAPAVPPRFPPPAGGPPGGSGHPGAAQMPPPRGPLIGTPPDEEDGDSPTVFIPRERH